MHHSIVKDALIAAALLLSASLCFAAEPGTAASATKAGTAKAAEKGGQQKATAAAKVKRVDINSAGKAELQTLPGIGSAQADKIIAGRPYLSKADLVADNILSQEAYEKIKKRVDAKRNKASEAKFNELKKKAR